jgi:hypothetical protein
METPNPPVKRGICRLTGPDWPTPGQLSAGGGTPVTLTDPFDIAQYLIERVQEFTATGVTAEEARVVLSCIVALTASRPIRVEEDSDYLPLPREIPVDEADDIDDSLGRHCQVGPPPPDSPAMRRLSQLVGRESANHPSSPGRQP